MALMTEVSLRECAERCRRGEPEALGLLYDRLAPRVARFLRGQGVPAGRIDDAVQEAFLRLFDRIAGLTEPERLPAYLFGIARNVAVDQARRAAAAAGRDVAVGARAARAEAEPADAPAVRAETRALTAAALDALAPERRATLALRHVAGLTMRDLALALDCSVPTARARLREAVRAFAAELRARGLDPEEVTW